MLYRGDAVGYIVDESALAENLHAGRFLLARELRGRLHMMDGALLKCS